MYFVGWFAMYTLFSILPLLLVVKCNPSSSPDFLLGRRLLSTCNCWADNTTNAAVVVCVYI